MVESGGGREGELLAWAASMGKQPLPAVFLAVWPAAVGLALAGMFTGWIWSISWWPVVYAVPVVTWTAGGLWWWVRGPRAPWQRAARGFAQAHIAALLIIDAVSLSGALGNMLESDGWVPATAGLGGIGGFYLLGFSVGVVTVLPGPAIAHAWAAWGLKWLQWCEWVATAAIGAWTTAGGLFALTVTA